MRVTCKNIASARRPAPSAVGWLIAAPLVVLLVASAAFHSPVAGVAAEAARAPSSAQFAASAPADPIVTAAGGYVLKDCDGKIAVFTPTGDEPLIVTDIDLAGLRSHDAKLLAGGIAVGDYEKLLKALEDFDA
jgi:hypothetical protein